jgi:tetratricopeptide (TPR) repeat protein
MILAFAARADSPTAPDFGTMTSSNVVSHDATAGQKISVQNFQVQLDLATQQRHDKSPALAMQTLISILETNAPTEFRRKALFELALAAQDNSDYVRAQQIFSQYLQLYSEDASAPEVLLRQGLLYRDMGVNTLAISKFYSVMSTALKLKLDNIDYYKTLVLQAQTEIAETYYLQGDFADASDFFARIIKADSPSLNKELIEYKLIRSLGYMTNHAETIARAQFFLDNHPASQDLPEVRFILASAYKGVGRNEDAMKQVLLLLQSEQENVRKNPEVWAYWQRRAGNEIANQLYKDADYLDALQIYQSLANLDPSAAWQAPVRYQIGLIYEQLQQWDRATNSYGLILARQAEMTQSNSPPSLSSICDMAQWRTQYIGWMEKARATNQELQRSPLLKAPATALR